MNNNRFLIDTSIRHIVDVRVAILINNLTNSSPSFNLFKSVPSKFKNSLFNESMSSFL